MVSNVSRARCCAQHSSTAGRTAASAAQPSKRCSASCTANQTHNPNPIHPYNIPFLPACIQAALGRPYKGNKSSGPSILPLQLIKHLHARNDDTISHLFYVVTIRGIPAAWNTSKSTPVFKKGSKALASNYRPVSIMGPVRVHVLHCLCAT